jgi:hypothetical protein
MPCITPTHACPTDDSQCVNHCNMYAATFHILLLTQYCTLSFDDPSTVVRHGASPNTNYLRHRTSIEQTQQRATCKHGSTDNLQTNQDNNFSIKPKQINPLYRNPHAFLTYGLVSKKPCRNQLRKANNTRAVQNNNSTSKNNCTHLFLVRNAAKRVKEGRCKPTKTVQAVARESKTTCVKRVGSTGGSLQRLSSKHGMQNQKMNKPGVQHQRLQPKAKHQVRQFQVRFLTSLNFCWFQSA